MRTFTRLLLIGAAAAAVILAACGDDDDDDGGGDGAGADTSATASATLSPSGPAGDQSPGVSTDVTATATSTPVPATPTAPPLPPKPSLGDGVQQVGEGTTTFVIEPNGIHQIDGLYLLQLQGVDPPPCAAFVLAFSWLITNPSPPTGQQVVWEIIRQDARDPVASGPEGSTTVGCGQLLAMNPGTQTISVSVYYVQGAIQ
jgi:hypothetical protein